MPNEFKNVEARVFHMLRTAATTEVRGRILQAKRGISGVEEPTFLQLDPPEDEDEEPPGTNEVSSIFLVWLVLTHAHQGTASERTQELSAILSPAIPNTASKCEEFVRNWLQEIRWLSFF